MEESQVKTPWGRPDEVTQIAEGIIWYDCPGHGGIGLSDDRYAQMPKYLQKTFAGGPWYEEDHDAAMVYCRFQKEFDDLTVQAAWESLRDTHPAEAERLENDLRAMSFKEREQQRVSQERAAPSHPARSGDRDRGR